MSELPDGWEWATLPQLVASDGVFIDGDWVESKDQDPNGDVRLIQLADIGEGLYRDRSSRFLTMAKAQELRCTFLEPGDVLVARMPDPLGRACLFPGDQKPSVTVVDVCVLRPGSRGANSRWLMHTLNAPQMRHAVEALAKGTTRKRISRKNLAGIRIPLPPIAQQERIVGVIETQFSRLDAGLQALDRAHQRVGQLADAAILSLLRGSEQTMHRLGDVADIRLGRQRSPKNHQGPSMHPYLRAANVTWDGLDLADVKEMNFTPSELATYRLEVGDVLVAEASGSASEVGKPAIWDGNIEECCFQNTLLRIRSRSVVPEYLYFALLGLARSGQFARASRGVGIHHLGKAGLSDLMIRVPDIEEQRSLIDTIGEQQRRFAALATAIDSQLHRSQRLRASVLARAFEGRLVPDEPSDESASEFLERVATERAPLQKPQRNRQPQVRSRQEAPV